MRPEDLQALLINLPRAEGRRRLMQAQLEQPGMPKYRIVAGVDGSALSNEDRQRLYDPQRTACDFGREITPNELGCTLAHVAVYREIVARDHALALVLEDDAVLGHQFLMELERLLPKLDADRPQLVLLSHVGRYSAWGGRRVDKEHWLYRPYTAWGSHAYLITLAGAKALLADQTPVHVTADSWMFHYRRRTIDLWGLVPYCVGTAPLAAAPSLGFDPLSQVRRRRGWRRWIHKYLWLKFAFQVFAKPLLRLRKQPSTW